MKNALIILDIDHTLIDTISIPDTQRLISRNHISSRPSLVDTYSNNAIWERPHLKQFLIFLSKNFKYIGIWTNGTKYWLTLIVEKILSKYIPKNRFLFLYHIDKSEIMAQKTMINNQMYIEHIYLKRLETVWREHKKYNINRQNTILIDDNVHNCVQNKNNCIPARKFSILIKKEDTFLKNVIHILAHLLKSKNFHQTLEKVYGNIHDYDRLFI
jgi:hypothetical protein